jgi:hypothetical protein
MLAARLIPVNEKTYGLLLRLPAQVSRRRKDDNANDDNGDFKKNLQAAHGVIRWMVGASSEVIGQSDKPPEAEQLRATQGVKLFDIPDDSVGPIPQNLPHAG